MNIYPTEEKFKELAGESKRVPVYAVLPFDQTPLEVALRLGVADNDGGFLLESLNGGPKTAHYSLLGTDPFLTFQSRGPSITITDGSARRTFCGDPFVELRQLMKKNESADLPELPLFTGGAVGYFSYDFGRWFERLPQTTLDDTKIPESYFLFYDLVLVFDHLDKKVFLICSVLPGDNLAGSYRSAVKRIEEASAKLRSSSRERKSGFTAGGPEANLTKNEFKVMVRQAKEYIFAGDIYQVNLSLRLMADFSGDSFSLYQALRAINPSPFAGFIDFGDIQIVSSSPERLIRVEGALVETRPIAGTRRRGVDLSEDGELTADLILDPKERAEHIMLVDLERNDIGRVCRYGSVIPDELMVTESYSHVIHIVSNVRGELLPNADCFDVIKACFPGGTITGCPKIRSMEIIDELEPVRRGVYTGSMGYLSFNGGMDLNIIIRTILIKEGKAYAQAGAGIVADSMPEREYFESLQKAQALINALKGH